MKFKHLSYLFLALPFFSGSAQANVTEADFLVKTTQNLVNLCTAKPQDIHYSAAINFCHGYLVGAFHFHHAETANRPELKLVCFPEPAPTRNEAIDQFITWVLKHPEFMNEIPVETEFRFLSQTWPCQ